MNRDDLPDGLSGIFLREGLDRILSDLPVGLFCRGPSLEIAFARKAKQGFEAG
jgi:hypothetical protein